jgi:hypothetical protein
LFFAEICNQMRWTNNFPHPGDNRYQVFVFKTAEMADAFRERLEQSGVSFEPHEEGGEWLFGVHRRDLKAAQRANHLTQADFRTHFIPHREARLTLLAATLVVILLALAGAFFSQASGQTQLVLHSAFQFPLEAVGSQSILTEDGPLTASWTPSAGSSLGLRIERELSDSWALATGVESIRNVSTWALAFNSEEGGPSGMDTLRLRSVRYRIPVLATTRVPITTGWSLAAGIGLSLDMVPTDVFVTGSLAHDSTFSDFTAAENRLRWWATPLQAELFIQHEPRAWRTGRESGLRAWAVGVRWWQEWTENRWGAATWRHGTELAEARIWMGTTAFAVEGRLYLD